MEHQISSDVDLIIYLINSDPSPSTTKYYVTAWSLQQASPVFSRIIVPGPRFRQPFRTRYAGKECLTITLEDDDPEALRIVFNLLHLNKKPLPAIKKLSWNTMREIAAIWDKYDISNLIRPPWVTHFQTKMLSFGYEDWLLVGRVFNEERDYAKLTALLVIELAEAKPKGKVTRLEHTAFFRAESPVDLSMWPDSIKNHITTERSRLLDGICSLMSRWKRKYRSGLPPIYCACLGDISYNLHQSLSDELRILFKGMDPSVGDQRPYVSFLRRITHLSNPFRRGVDPSAPAWNWTGSILELQSILGKFANKLPARRVRQLSYTVDNARLFRPCPVEELTLEMMHEFRVVTAVVKGINTDGKEVDFVFDRLIPDYAKDAHWGWGYPRTNWHVLSVLGLSIFVVSLLASAVMAAAAAWLM
ncbi:hypothetical protein TWF696_001615 [Orbilia brochopaga]|uniref:BTB domain-containing protein n=1 Tax=Orbilia brochopaga TaxID=3140254 RepID=A0AAV9UCR1_9PEZI